MERTILLNDETVRQVFPGTHPELALGEEGYIAYDFNRSYPGDLAFFCPLEFPRSQYNHAAPRSLEDAFCFLDDEVARLSRQHEIDLRTRFEGLGVQFIVGRVVKRPGFDARHTVFRFDGLDGPRQCLDVLCRVYEGALEHGLKKQGKSRRAWDMELFSANVRYHGTVGGSPSIHYWIQPVSDLFRDTSQLVAAVFMMSLALI